jgi:hypothetical protein
MQSPQLDWLHRIEATDDRLRVSRELFERSLQSVCRSRDLVLQSKALLAREQESILQSQSGTRSLLASHPGTEETPARAPVSPAKKSSRVSEGLEVVSNRCIRGELVNMDGKHFVDCELLHCTLQYSGQPVVLESTRFEHCGFQFTAEAALTARFLECFQLLPERTVDYASSPTVSGSMRRN